MADDSTISNDSDVVSMATGVGSSSTGFVTLVLTACIGTVGANSLALGPIAPELARAFSTNTVEVMYAGAAYGLGTALGALCLSPLVDRIGARQSLLAALAALVVAFVASALAPSVLWLTAAQALAGLVSGLALPAIYAFAALIAPPGQESRVLGRVLVGWTLSLVAGVSLSTLVADIASWRLVYVAFASLAFAALGALAQVRTNESREHKTRDLTWPLSTVFIPGVAPYLLLCLGFMFAFYGVYGYVGDHVVQALGLPLRSTAIVTLAYGAGFGVAAFGDRLIDRFGATRALPWAFAAIFLVYAVLAVGASSFTTLVGAAFVWGLANHFGVNLILAGLSAIEPRRRGAILGAYSATTYLAASIGTVLLGWLYETSGFAALAKCAAIVVALAALLGIMLLRQRGAASRQQGG